MKIIQKHLLAECLTQDDSGYSFFGYFDKSPWNPHAGFHLVQKTLFLDIQPRFGEKAQIGMPGERNRFIPFASPLAWNRRQGAMPPEFDGQRILCNDMEEAHHVSRILGPSAQLRQTHE